MVMVDTIGAGPEVSDSSSEEQLNQSRDHGTTRVRGLIYLKPTETITIPLQRN
jgi:hypothetical protein